MAVMLDIASMMPYANGEALRDFALTHRLAHDAIASAVAAQFSVATPNFDVADERAHQEWELLMLHAEGAPTTPSQALKDWLTVHQRLHQAEYGAAGLSELPDLSTVNFHDRGQFYQWMQDHQAIHDAIESSLGIS